MNTHDIRRQIHVILTNHTEALKDIRAAHKAMQAAFLHHDAALVSTIEATKSALLLIGKLLDEGIEPEPPAA